MKKILAAVTVAAVMVSGVFALNFEVAAGGAYGWTTERNSTTAKSGDTETKTVFDSTDHSIGGQLEGTAWLNNKLGLRATTDFLFPVSNSTKTTTYKNGVKQDSKGSSNDMSNAFVFNALIGPVFTLNAKSSVKFTVGGGFDFQYNNYSTVIPATVIGGYTITPKTTITNSYLSYGFGANADAALKLNKKASLKAGVSAGVLWGNSVTTTTKVDGEGKSSSSGDYDKTRFFLIPAVSVVYKL